LMAFISAIPATLSVGGNKVKSVEINFLCVHKKLRSHRLAPVLIQEITRRVQLTGIFQAAYTAGVYLPTPVASCRYWHRSLNPKKLIDVKFSYLARNKTLKQTIEEYAVAAETTTPGLRPMESKDVPQAHALLAKYLEATTLHPLYDKEDFAHWFLPRAGVINTYVVESESGEITNMLSFYTLNSSVIGHPVHSHLKAAYSYYNVASTVSMPQLVMDALILAKKENFDVFNALDVMRNSECLEELLFGKGDGVLQYYLYNYRCPPMQSASNGLVLL